MHVNKRFSIKHALVFNAFFVLNFVIWLLGFQIIAPLIFTGLLIYFCYFAFDSFKLKHTLPLLIILYLGLLSLGMVATSWDARSIWLFHAKRIFIDNSIFAQLDDYATWSHNDYPVMLPLLSASFAKLIGYWNEIFPKTSNVFFILPPLLIFSDYLKNNRWFVLFVIGVFYILAKLLINGYMDGILTLYALSTLVLLNQFSKDNKNKLLLFLILLQGCVLVSIKNEGVYIFSILILCLCIMNFGRIQYFLKQSWILIVPYFFWLIWRLACQHFGVHSDMEEGLLTNIENNSSIFSLIQYVNGRLTIENLLLIFQHVFISKYHFLGLIAVTIALLNKFSQWTRIDSLLSIFICLFFLFLTVIYLLTPYDMYWHLKTSATRTTLPIQLACFFLLLNTLRQFNFRDTSRG
jgi:hypothetical protein